MKSRASEVTGTGSTQRTAGDVDAGLGKDLEVDLTEFS
jgi:hypothetical protein